MNTTLTAQSELDVINATIPVSNFQNRTVFEKALVMDEKPTDAQKSTVSKDELTVRQVAGFWSLESTRIREDQRAYY
uniref:Uncharacterized protein n=1 Tax=Romanomermis culicivorax TaxID=13658 RepID=A0A915I3D8_ROMCU